MSRDLPTELRNLRALFQSFDPVPPHLAESAYAAVGRRSPAGSAALELVGDSAESLARVRAPGPEPRVLTFAMPGRVLELDLVPTVEGWYRASGMVLNRAGQAPPEGDVVLRHPAGECVGPLDEHGAFQVVDVPRGPLSVVFRPVRSAPAIADWLVC
ncbi:hypothetical protein GCM10011581_32360 [Saccharopolyspora subtropica]|uniref:Uncharacterized protein n=1 Tax=Saccharopolyspora thermophila TaxID=89367 RepID=A0A917NFF1_9PSEU|nr:hypothetical protein [Saccharopolyspora subtropica]GGI92702.1 hypothetical protein GCM10011581_32360 [Saccharopolyspora subtropica]